MNRDAIGEPCRGRSVILAWSDGRCCRTRLDLVAVAVDVALALGPSIMRSGSRRRRHVLGRDRDRPAGGRRQDVVRRQHEHPCLGLGLGGQRQVHGHLVPVEVRVERRADERWIWIALPSTSTGSKPGCPIGARSGHGSEHRVLLDDALEHVQTCGRLRSTMRLADLMFWASSMSTSRFMTNGLKSSSAHQLGQAALVEQQRRPITMTERPE